MLALLISVVTLHAIEMDHSYAVPIRAISRYMRSFFVHSGNFPIDSVPVNRDAFTFKLSIPISQKVLPN